MVMMKETRKRWKSDTPAFFRKVIKIGLTVGAIGGAILTAPITLPAGIISLGGYMVVAGLVSAGVAKTTKI